ncbi:hypothetical protein KFL_000150430 [Klebsormidium nitens]|uniref:C3H1-type domain-containing protein n=1 Tax=Klebsormidium nitens TaxID=105231 RepID=A0A1Y1HN32_KLENI|nr:hypothetical protein KFL_000150430 [Klebsormidium nitens]|eukprot:GAQ78589.1 hypothetical protein KFL_000150430 [Klebsormidium nitens]
MVEFVSLARKTTGGSGKEDNSLSCKGLIGHELLGSSSPASHRRCTSRTGTFGLYKAQDQYLIMNPDKYKVTLKPSPADPNNLKDVDIEGTGAAVQSAASLIQRTLADKLNNPGGSRPGAGAASPFFKTRMCEKFMQGACTFGDNSSQPLGSTADSLQRRLHHAFKGQLQEQNSASN